MEMKYHLLEWEAKEDCANDISVVPHNWLVTDEKLCKWPSKANSHMIKRCAMPQEKWPTYPYRRIVKSTDDWERAMRWERKYAIETDVETSEMSEMDSRKRGRIPKRTWETSSLSSQESPIACRSKSSAKRGPAHSPSISDVCPLSQRKRSVSLSPLSHFESPPKKTKISGRKENRLSMDCVGSPAPGHRMLDLYSQMNDYNYTSSGKKKREAFMECDCTAARYHNMMLPYIETLMRNMARMNTMMSPLQGRLERLEETVRKLTEIRPDMPVMAELPEGFTYPLDSVEELERLDKALAAPVVFRKLVQHITAYGGRDYREAIRKIGGTLMTPRLQSCYNLNGVSRAGPPKLPFTKLIIINKALHDAMMDKFAVEKKPVTTYISEWLSTWRDRMPGGKANRVSGRSVGENEAVVESNDTSITEFCKI